MCRFAVEDRVVVRSEEEKAEWVERTARRASRMVVAALGHKRIDEKAEDAPMASSQVKTKPYHQ